MQKSKVFNETKNIAIVVVSRIAKRTKVMTVCLWPRPRQFAFSFSLDFLFLKFLSFLLLNNMMTFLLCVFFFFVDD